MKMKCLLFTVAFLAVAFARPGPDVSHITDIPSGSYLPGQDSHGGSHYELNYNKDQHLHVPGIVQNQKRVYYFSSPELNEQQGRLRVNIIPYHQRNTNVLFVKAPHYNPPVPEIHVPPSHIEDKTKVVVLVKRPEELAPVNIPAPPPIQHGKPEVLVVKYKNQHEAERAVAKNSGAYTIGSNIHRVRDEHTFVKTLEGSQIPQIGISAGLYQPRGSIINGPYL